ncbi:MAG TPA: hypothetical protein VGD46_19525 [Rhizobacter sp.]
MSWTEYALIGYALSVVLATLSGIENIVGRAREDKARRDATARMLAEGKISMDGYCPSVTYGDVGQRAFLAVCPVVNTGVAAWFLVRHALDLTDLLDHYLRQPLVPRKDRER